MSEFRIVETDAPGRPEKIALQLRRAPNPGKPPVLLLHGASAQHETFLTPKGRSIAEFLWNEGLEPWLLDWRGSKRVTDEHGVPLLQRRLLRDKRDELDFDHAAEQDLQWALQAIKAAHPANRERGRIRVLGHCMGAGVLAQAIAAGNLDDFELGPIVLQTLGLFYEPPLDGRLKSQDYVLDRLWQEKKILDIDPRRPLGDWPRELAEIYRHWAPGLRPHPHSAVHPDSSHALCDRVGFMYGVPYRERNLVPEIHGRERVHFTHAVRAPRLGERLRCTAPKAGVPGGEGYVSGFALESGSFRAGDARGWVELGGPVGSFGPREADAGSRWELRADDEAVVASSVGASPAHSLAPVLGEQFGRIPLKMYLQGAQHVRRSWAAPFDEPTHDLWLGDAALQRFRSLPAVTLLTGARNQLWHRDSVDRMAEWLRRGSTGHCRVEKIVLEEYAHQDLLWGVDSQKDVFPILAAALAEPGGTRVGVGPRRHANGGGPDPGAPSVPPDSGS